MKICPKCNNSHSKNGKFCSRKCSNSRTWSAEDKLKKSIAALNSDKVKISSKLRGELRIKNSVRIKVYCSVCDCYTNTVLKKSAKSNYICSDECLRKWNSISGKKSAAKLKKRSKDELALEKLCLMHWKTGHGFIEGCNWDADILLYDHKIAIMWNGPWHYREMHMTNHSLAQVVNRDCLTIIEFEKLGWEVLIYEDNKWTPETALIDIYSKILDITSGIEAAK